MILRSIFTRVTNIWQSILTSLIVGGGKACATTTRPMIWLGTVLPWDSDTLSRRRPVMWITCNRTVSIGHSQIYLWDVTEFYIWHNQHLLVSSVIIMAAKVPSVSSRQATEEECYTLSISQGSIITMLCYCYFSGLFFFFLEEVHNWIKWPERWALSCERKHLYYQPLLMDDVCLSPNLKWVGLQGPLLSEVGVRAFLHWGVDIAQSQRLRWVKGSGTMTWLALWSIEILC